MKPQERWYFNNKGSGDQGIRGTRERVTYFSIRHIPKSLRVFKVLESEGRRA